MTVYSVYNLTVLSCRAGTNRVRFSSNFYAGVDHQDHCVRLRASSVLVPAQWLELARLHHRRSWVSN